MDALTTPRECLERAIQFKDDAEALVVIDNQWYAVAYFYSAYHSVRAALLEDPVFRDPSRLATFSTDLTPDDSSNTHHRARLGNGPRKPGVNDLVKMLYPAVAVEYVRLHGASVAVRYGLGLDGYERDVLVADFRAIADAAASGTLVA